jgi:uncharacterized protein with FMN-binding domain
MRWEFLLLLAVLGLGGAGCRQGVAVQTAPLAAPVAWGDGTYIGESDLPTPQFIRVAVDITRGRIVAIHLLEHPAWTAPEQQDALLRLVMESQTTEGHVSRGTGDEQDRLLRAIDAALAKARPARPAAP